MLKSAAWLGKRRRRADGLWYWPPRRTGQSA
ncbi:hypothetical protein [Aquidulcibacter sp.]